MAKRKKTKIEHAEIVGLFAARLRQLRLARGMTQLQLARQAQVSLTYVGRLEKQEAAPGIDTVQRLAAALGCTAHDLLPPVSPVSEVDVLREQIRRQTEILVQNDDPQTLALVAQLLARICETTPH